jgi:hypothetical protein
MSTIKAPATIAFKPVTESVVDAFTGGPLVGAVAKCAKCMCCYGAESLAALKKHNQGRCMGCGELMASEAGS